MEKSHAALVIVIKKGIWFPPRFYLAEKNTDIHKDNGESLADSKGPNAYGGKVKANESILDCALRELTEEAGINAEASDLIEVGNLQFFWPGNKSPVDYDMRVTVFILKEYEGEPRQTKEMGPPRDYSMLDAPFERMQPADKLIFHVIMSGNKLSAKIHYIMKDGKKCNGKIASSIYAPVVPFL